MQLTKSILDLRLKLIKERFSYDPTTGIVFDKISNKEAGSISTQKNGSKRRIITFRNRNYFSYQMAFLLMEGYIPELIDHLDRNALNNKWKNLRAADRSINGHNTGDRKNNTSGYKNVWFDKRRRKFSAQICINRRRYNLGYFISAEEAAMVIKEFRIKNNIE